MERGLGGEAKTRCAFVSTNSISQGEQVGILWNELFNKYHIKIHFAHRTFQWSNEAKGNAAVHVVIIGFSNFDVDEKYLYEYDDIKAEPHEVKVKNISPYLIEGKDFAVINRSTPICKVPELKTGNKPIDDGNLIFIDEQKIDFLKKEPNAKKWMYPFLGAEEFINGNYRWILFLKDITPTELKQLPEVLKRVELVKQFRSNSKSAPTKKLASFPTRFHTENMPVTDFLVIPQVSSERRRIIPIAFLKPPIVCSDKLRLLTPSSLYHFGILSSTMHMAWVRVVSGRLKSDYQYSVLTVYNNYPWPETPTEKQKQTVEEKAQQVLDVRKQFPGSSLADLYDPLTMPPALVKAHNELDKAVDLCYRPQPFPSETKRIEFLFELYDRYTAGLFSEQKKKNKKKSM
ncbi:MAG: class I SAM-dependent DNA methyltransferase [Bacteroidia bacterium]|nr:class I SAM-dependent DNA methyltransferase [Bacteroidia bacterium]